MKLPPPNFRYRAKIVRIHDGDTVFADVDLGFQTWLHEEPIRLLGINAPELSTKDGPGATDFLEGLVHKYGELWQGSYYVTLESFKDKREKYGRMLGKLLGVHGDGSEVCLNDEMLSAGYAKPMTLSGAMPK